MRILLTGYSDLDAMVRSVNESEVYRFVTKPWDIRELPRLIGEAADIAKRTPAIAPMVDVPEPAPPEHKASPPAPASARPAESDASLSPLTLKLSKSGDFKALAGASKYRDPVLQAVDFLARRQGVAPTNAFADALGIPGWRVTQTIARYTELLNLDGELILHVDLRAQQVRLDISRLTAAFGLEK